MGSSVAYYLADVVIVADAGKNDLGVLRRSGRSVCAVATVFFTPLISFSYRTIEYRNFMAGSFKVSGHWKAHDAQADKRDSHN